MISLFFILICFYVMNLCITAPVIRRRHQEVRTSELDETQAEGVMVSQQHLQEREDNILRGHHDLVGKSQHALGKEHHRRRKKRNVGKEYPWHILRNPIGKINPWALRPSIHLVPHGGTRQASSDVNGTLTIIWMPIHQVHIKLVLNQRVLEIVSTGLYFMYAQIHYNWENTSRSMGHCISVGDTQNELVPVICSRTAADAHGEDMLFRNVNTNYVGGAFYLKEGAFVSVTMFRETGSYADRNNTVLANNDFTYFGAFMLA